MPCATVDCVPQVPRRGSHWLVVVPDCKAVPSNAMPDWVPQKVNLLNQFDRVCNLYFKDAADAYRSSMKSSAAN